QRVFQQHVRRGDLVDHGQVEDFAPEIAEPAADDGLVVILQAHGGASRLLRQKPPVVDPMTSALHSLLGSRVNSGSCVRIESRAGPHHSHAFRRLLRRFPGRRVCGRRTATKGMPVFSSSWSKTREAGSGYAAAEIGGNSASPANTLSVSDPVYGMG